MSTVAEIYIEASNFELMLDTAEPKVRGSKEEDFVAGLRQNFERYGPKMFLSDPQDRWLTQIARR